jgi:hypothetical protein
VTGHLVVNEPSFKMDRAMRKSAAVVVFTLAVFLSACGQGQQGPKGEQGPPGPQGAKGDQGPPALPE